MDHSTVGASTAHTSACKMDEGGGAYPESRGSVRWQRSRPEEMPGHNKVKAQWGKREDRRQLRKGKCQQIRLVSTGLKGSWATK